MKKLRHFQPMHGALVADWWQVIGTIRNCSQTPTNSMMQVADLLPQLLSPFTRPVDAMAYLELNKGTPRFFF